MSLATLGVVFLAVGLLLLLSPRGEKGAFWTRGRRGGGTERVLDRLLRAVQEGGGRKRLRQAQARDWVPVLWAEAAVLYSPAGKVGLREALRLAVEHRGGWVADGLRAALEAAQVADVGDVLREWAASVQYGPLQDDVAALVAAHRAGVDLGETLRVLGERAAERQLGELDLATSRSEVIATLVGVPAALMGLMGLLGYVLLELFSMGLGGFLGG
jgi:hypothetical protein